MCEVTSKMVGNLSAEPSAHIAAIYVLITQSQQSPCKNKASSILASREGYTRVVFTRDDIF